MEAPLQTRLKELCKDDSDVVFASINVHNPDALSAPYEQITDRALLKAFMELKLTDYNEQARIYIVQCVVPDVGGLSVCQVKGAGMNLVLFRDAIEHCCRIHRVILMPKGNCLLVGVGGSGRHSMARLASFIADYQCVQIEITKNYRYMNAHKESANLFMELISTGTRNSRKI